MKVRQPRAAELQSLSRLCLRSKAHWGYNDAFMRACQVELTLTVQELSETVVAVAEDQEGRAVGVAQVVTEGDEAWVEKLFVEPRQIGTGTGTRLYRWCLETARERGALVLITESDPNAVSFYVKMGATLTGTAPSASIRGRLLPKLVHRLT